MAAYSLTLREIVDHKIKLDYGNAPCVPVIHCRVCREVRLDDGSRCEECGFYQDRNLIPVRFCCRQAVQRDPIDHRRLLKCDVCGQWPKVERLQQ